MEVYSATRPEFYTIERTHDNKLIVRFAEEITEIPTDEGPIWRYLETVGTFPWSDAFAGAIRRNPAGFLAKRKDDRLLRWVSLRVSFR